MTEVEDVAEDDEETEDRGDGDDYGDGYGDDYGDDDGGNGDEHGGSSDGEDLTCSICGNVFHSHMKEKHAGFVCLVGGPSHCCGFEVETEAELKTHLRRVHSATLLFYEEDEEDDEYVCPLCESKHGRPEVRRRVYRPLTEEAEDDEDEDEDEDDEGGDHGYYD